MIFCFFSLFFLSYRLQRYWPLYTLGTIVPILFLAPNWLVHVFPGFAIYSVEVSLIRRYSAEIGFYGLVVGMVISLAPWLFRKLFNGTPVGKPAEKPRDSSGGDGEQQADT
jgi:hypothetical protein